MSLNQYKYNVGQRVLVKSDLAIGTRYYMHSGPYANNGWISPRHAHMMSSGKVVTIRECDRGYRLEEQPNDIMFSDEMFESVVEDGMSFMSLL